MCWKHFSLTKMENGVEGKAVAKKRSGDPSHVKKSSKREKNQPKSHKKSQTKKKDSKDKAINLPTDHPKTKKKKKKKKEKKEKKEPLKLKAGESVITRDKVTYVVHEKPVIYHGFSFDIFRVTKKGHNKTWAMKTELTTLHRLKVEVALLQNLDKEHRRRKNLNPNFASWHFLSFQDSGLLPKYKFLITDMAGPSLRDIRKVTGMTITQEEALWISYQMLEAIEALHFIGYIHRSISPAKFAVGKGTEFTNIYLTDLKYGKQIIDPTTRNFINPKTRSNFHGALRFSSRGTHSQKDQSYADDLESWMYTTFDIFDPQNGVPWKKIQNHSEVLEKKKELFSTLCPKVFENVPVIYKDVAKYIDGLNYLNKPDYKGIFDMLKSIGTEIGTNPVNPSWIGTETCILNLARAFQEGNLEYDEVKQMKSDDLIASESASGSEKFKKETEKKKVAGSERKASKPKAQKKK